MWKGCVQEDFHDIKSAEPIHYVTPHSEEANNYRHFAVHLDAEIEIVYFCDFNPYVTGMLCYSSDQKAAENTWTGEEIENLSLDFALRNIMRLPRITI